MIWMELNWIEPFRTIYDHFASQPSTVPIAFANWGGVVCCRAMDLLCFTSMTEPKKQAFAQKWTSLVRTFLNEAFHHHLELIDLLRLHLFAKINRFGRHLQLLIDHDSPFLRFICCVLCLYISLDRLERDSSEIGSPRKRSKDSQWCEWNAFEIRLVAAYRLKIFCMLCLAHNIESNVNFGFCALSSLSLSKVFHLSYKLIETHTLAYSYFILNVSLIIRLLFRSMVVDHTHTVNTRNPLIWLWMLLYEIVAAMLTDERTNDKEDGSNSDFYRQQKHVN